MRRALIILGLLVCSVGTVSAQDIRLDRLDLGLRGGYEFDDVSEFSVGGEARAYLKDQPFFINPAAEIYLMDPGRPNIWHAEVNASYLVNSTSMLIPYFGTGLAYTEISNSERRRGEAGVNVILGLFIEVTYVRLFVQGRSTLGNFDTASVQAGMSFPFIQRSGRRASLIRTRPTHGTKAIIEETPKPVPSCYSRC